MCKLVELLKKMRRNLFNHDEDLESVKVKDQIRAEHFDRDMNYTITKTPKSIQ